MELYGCFQKWWYYPISHPKMIIFRSGKPHGFVGETHPFRKLQYRSFHLGKFRNILRLILKNRILFFLSTESRFKPFIPLTLFFEIGFSFQNFSGIWKTRWSSNHSFSQKRINVQEEKREDERRGRSAPLKIHGTSPVYLTAWIVDSYGKRW